jgi:hypothetical protein
MSGSAKAGTIAERHTCELRVLPKFAVRAPPKRASGGIFFSLTKTYMEVGNSEVMTLEEACDNVIVTAPHTTPEISERRLRDG